MATDEASEQLGPVTENPNLSTAFTENLSNQSFQTWYQEQQFQKNILAGQAYFNSPSPAPDPEKHIPSKLLKCKRKVHYSRHNAPKENQPPEGLFWFGSTFEEEIIVPWLQDVAPQNIYIQNGIWIDSSIEYGDYELRLKGSTDPAIVTGEVDPLVVTEVKTTTSLEYKTEPSAHHKAQLTAYLYALSQQYDHEVTGMLLYGDRDTFDLRVFEVSFDEEFWESVVEWMAELTEYEQSDELPPAEPERDWECEYCSFKHRCGKGDSPFADVGQDGLLPLFDGYDRQNLEEYLEAHEDRDARLTPTLATKYTDLVQEYGAYDWTCAACGAACQWDAIDWDGDIDNPPYCPACIETGDMVVLSGPEPSEQL